MPTTLLISHGDAREDLGDTFVPQGYTLHTNCRSGESTSQRVSLAQVAGAGLPGVETFKEGNRIENLILLKGGDGAVARHVAGTARASGYDIRYLGADGLPNEMLLCTTPDVCTYPNHAADCGGIFNPRYMLGPIIHLTACRSTGDDAPVNMEPFRGPMPAVEGSSEGPLSDLDSSMDELGALSDLDSSTENLGPLSDLDSSMAKFLGCSDRDVLRRFLGSSEATRAMLATIPALRNAVEAAWAAKKTIPEQWQPYRDRYLAYVRDFDAWQAGRTPQPSWFEVLGCVIPGLDSGVDEEQQVHTEPDPPYAFVAGDRGDKFPSSLQEADETWVVNFEDWLQLGNPRGYQMYYFWQEIKYIGDTAVIRQQLEQGLSVSYGNFCYLAQSVVDFANEYGESLPSRASFMRAYDEFIAHARDFESDLRGEMFAPEQDIKQYDADRFHLFFEDRIAEDGENVLRMSVCRAAIVTLLGELDGYIESLFQECLDAYRAAQPGR
ncbi:hypothetical protein ACFCXT_30480 [Streptomyces vinaceus]|uniref:hypothetical protein n=1 Tax=Streptomyces vinaceus TaxID=1960 RepID=UPI0035D5B74B